MNRSRLRKLPPRVASLMCSTALLSGGMASVSVPAFAQAVNLGQQNGNLIIPDGRTATTLSGSGRTTSISTSTLSGGNAFNSFSKFKAGAGNTVNLQVPSSARTLVNIVRDGPVDIQGTLNSFKNGKIGGNVVFSDSFGFVVGKSGVVNTGSLSVVTPTRDVNEAVIGRNGVVNDAAAARLIRGDVPLSPDGSVAIAGRINAEHGVMITAHDVDVAGSVDGARKEAARRAQFESTVNTSGLAEGGEIVVRNGSIRIVAAGNAHVGGRLSAGGHEGHAGSVSVKAGQDLTVDASAEVSARTSNASRRRAARALVDTAAAAQGPAVSLAAGNKLSLAGKVSAKAAANGTAGRIEVTSGGDTAIASTAVVQSTGLGGTDGGHIRVYADGNLLVANSATFSAAAKGTGNGGHVELSATHTAAIGTINLDLSAVSGQAGSLLLDPYDLVIGTQSPGSPNSTLSANVLSHGASITLAADHSITVQSGGSIDSRNLDPVTQRSLTSSGAITVSAPLITVLGGGQIRADVNNGTGPGATNYAAGDISLLATADAASQGVAAITLGDTGGTRATIAGHNLLLQATSTVPDGPDHATILVQNADVTGNGTAQLLASATGTAAVNSIGALADVDVLASVDVIGSAHLVSTGAMTLGSTASATVTATGASPFTGSLPGDASAAVATISSVATTHIGGTATVSTTGAGSAMSLSARNTVLSTVTADASASGASAASGSVAVNVVQATTTASVDGDAVVNSAGDLQLSARSLVAATTAAKAAAQGGSSDTPSGVTAEYLGATSGPGAKYAEDEKTTDGAVAATGALSISDLTSTTSATMSASHAATATGALGLSSITQNSANSTADGSAGGSQTGIGVGLAIGLAHVSNTATIAQSVTAASVGVSATMDGAAAGNAFATSASSGAGASNVGVAGSLATNLLDSESAASIASGTVTITGAGAVLVASDNETSSSVAALPSGAGASGGKVGVGASVALNLVATRSNATIASGVVLTGAGDLTLQADADHAVTTQADQGSSGGVAVTPVVALSLVDDQTQAVLGTPGVAGSVSVSGTVLVSATQRATEATEANGSAAGGKAAVGAALALALVNDDVEATTTWSITSTGGTGVSFRASGASLSVVSATASASGGNGSADGTEGEAGSAAPSSKEDSTVDGKVQKLSSSASDKETNAGVGSTEQQGEGKGAATKENGSASTSEGSVAVAAAIAVDVSTSTVKAFVPASVDIATPGALEIAAVNNTDALVSADGSQVGSDAAAPKIGIGAAVAVSVVHVVNDATLGTSGGAGTYNAGSIAVSALNTDLGATTPAVPGSTAAPAPVANTALGRPDQIGASATSGAGAGNVGIAGSLGVVLLDSESAASIASGTVTITGAGAVLVASDNETSSSVAALPSGAGASGGKVGVGASVALNLVATRSNATIASGVVLTGAGDLTLQADADHAVTTQADQGSSGGVAVTPVVALSLVDDQTQAVLGTPGVAGSVSVSGTVLVSATQRATEATEANGSAAGGKAAVGAALALALVNDDVEATTTWSIASTGGTGVSFRASGASLSVVSATASASGGNGSADGTEGEAGSAAPSSKEDSTVDGKVQKLSSSASDKETNAGVGSTEQQGEGKGAATKENGSASTSEGSVAVAAAIAVDVSTSTVKAFVPASVDIATPGALEIAAVNNTDALVSADGSQVGSDAAAPKIGIGAAVAVSVVHVVNDATLGTSGGAGTYNAGSIAVSALNTDLGATTPAVPGSTAAPAPGANTALGRPDQIGASATSGAGAGNVGIAGSLGVVLLDSESAASIASGTVTITGAGAVLVASDNETSSSVAALPSGAGASGGKVGVGASVALNLVATRSNATIASGVVLTGAGDLTLQADADHAVTTQADQGSSGGVAVTPVVALSLVDDQTQAVLGTPGVAGSVSVSGTVLVSATQRATEATEANGSAAGGKAAVGAALALALVNDDVEATTTWSIASTGGTGVSFRASGASLSVVSATASASGGNGSADGTEGEAGSAAPSSKEDSTVDGKVQKLSSSASDKETNAGVGSTEQQGEGKGAATKENGSASTSEGSVAVAAAIAVDVSTSTVKAFVPGSVDITTPGALEIAAVNNTDALVSADGSQVGSDAAAPKIGIGAAVAVSVVHVVNDATLGTSGGAGTYNAGSIAVSALNTDLGATTPAVPGSTAAPAPVANTALGRPDQIGASATSGAGAGNVGIAGSLGVVLLDSESAASIASGTVTITGAGAVLVASDNETSSSVAALPSGAGASGGKVGVGASVALNLVATRSNATIASGVVLTGAGDLTLQADADHAVTTQADQGSSGGVAVTPVVALSLVDDQTQAVLGTPGVAGSVSVSGTVLVSATQRATEATEANGSAAGGKAAVGAALALALVNDDVEATTTWSIASTGGTGVSFRASGASLSVVSATASASGGNGSADGTEGEAGSAAPSSKEDSTVDGKVQKLSSSASDKETNAGVGSTEQQGEGKGAATKENGSASTSEGSVAVAAAIAVDVSTSTVKAFVPASVDITTPGALEIAAVNNTDALVSADGSQVGGPKAQTKVGVGAGVAVSVVKIVNDATLGKSGGAGTYSAGSVSVTALKTDLGATTPAVPGSTVVPTPVVDTALGRPDQIGAEGTSGAGATNVGVAGSLGVVLLDSESVATIASGTLTITGGAVEIASDNETASSVAALPSAAGAAGGKVGVGASVALNTVTMRSQASLADGVALSGAGSLAIKADALTNTETTATGGAKGGIAIDAVVALSILSETTSATLGSGSATTFGGDVSVTATSEGENLAAATGAVDAANKTGQTQNASAGGTSASNGAGVGASAAIITGTGIIGAVTNSNAAITSSTTASVARDLTVGGALTVTAESTRTYDAEATAIAGGALFNESDPSEGGKSTSVDTLNTKQAQGAMDKVKNTLGSSGGGSKLSVAAALGAALVGDQVKAEIVGSATDKRTLTVDGAVTVEATSTGNLIVVGDGVTVSKTSVGIGIGAALAVLDNQTGATIADGTHLIVGGDVSVTATSTQNRDPAYATRLTAQAMSGASGQKIAVAGSLAVAISTSATTATLGDGVTIDATTDPHPIAGAVDVAATSTAPLSAKAWGGAYSSSGTGVGASIAAVIAEDTTSASIGNDATVNAASLAVTATDVKIDVPQSVFNLLVSDVQAGSYDDARGTLKTVGTDAMNNALLGENNYYTEVLAGAASGGQNAIAGGFGIQVIGNTVLAKIGTGASIGTTGAIAILADDQTVSKALDGSLAVSLGSTSVGVSSTIVTDTSTVTALLDAGATVTASGSLAVTATSAQSVDVFEASAAVADQISVSGILGVITLDVATASTLGAGSHVTSSGAVAISAADAVSVINLAGAISGSGQTAIGATAVATTVLNTVEAQVNSDAANRTVLDAGSILVTAALTDRVINLAVAGGVAGEAAVVGAATPVTQNATVLASIGQDATLTAATSIGVTASDDATVYNIGGAAAVAGTTGIGGSAAVSTFADTTRAFIDTHQRHHRGRGF